jgi:hypothetical protein
MRIESEETRFSEGTGLPGKIWSTRAPVLFDQFRVVDFVRAEAARSAGLSAGFGLPVIDGDQFTAALTILLGDKQHSFVCELWTPSEGGTLQLRSGYYGQYRRFHGISSLIKFPYGQGLPGIVWATKSPQIIENLGTSPEFWRAMDARREGLFTGLGIPVSTRAGLEVVLLLSSKECPIARAIEIWKPDGAGMKLVQSSYGELHALASAGPHAVASEEGLAAVVQRTRLPIVTEDVATIEPSREEAIDASGLTVGVGFPVFVDGELNAVIVLLN